MTKPPDLMEAAVGSTELCRLEPKWLRVTYTFAIEMTETPDLTVAADGSTELCRLEPKWLRVTYTCEIEMNEMAELMEAAKDSSVMRNKMKESDKLWTEWNKQNLCCENPDDAVDLCENALSHDFGAILAILDILSTSGDGSIADCLNFNVTRKENTSVDGMENRDIPLLKFWSDEGRQLMMDFNMNDRDNVEIKMSKIVKKLPHNKLLWTGETDADNKTGVYMVMLTFHKNWWFDWRNADAAAAIAIVIESPYKHLRMPRRRTCTRGYTNSSRRARSLGPRRTSSTRMRTSQNTRRMHHGGIAMIESTQTDPFNDGDIRKDVSLHRASSNDNMYADESGDTGEWIFQRLMLSLFELLGMVGWQNAHFKKQKQERTKKHVFRPFQQQREATALGISEAAPNDEYGSYTSEDKYNDLNDGRYEKTIYVKTWTGRTITVVFSPERATRFMKKEIERKTGIPTDHQQLVAGGRVLMDNTSLKEIGLSDGRTIELTA